MLVPKVGNTFPKSLNCLVGIASKIHNNIKKWAGTIFLHVTSPVSP